MKYIFVIFAVIICASAYPADVNDYKNKAQSYVSECQTEAGVSKETASNIKNGLFNDSDDEKTKCFVNCFFKKAGFADENGELQADIIFKKTSRKPEVKDITSEDLKKIVDKCVQEKGANPCEKAYNVYKCYRSDISYKR